MRFDRSTQQGFVLPALLVLCSQWVSAEDKPLRLGLIGLDTSHVIAFTAMFNDVSREDHIPGARVVAAFKGGSPDVAASANRIDGFTKELVEKWKVELVTDIPTLCEKVDAVLIESVDGRPHLEQLGPVLAAKKPVFIDKPFAGSLADAKKMARLIKESGVPCFSSSSLRFYGSVTALEKDESIGEILGVEAFSPCALEPHHPDLYWYGVHGVEILFTLMGPGCDEVTRVKTKDFDLVTGRWNDGRIGTFRGIRRGKSTYGARVFGSKGIRVSDPVKGSVYRPMLIEMLKFFRTGKAPVSIDETLEMFAFMSAADESEKRGGAPVKIADVLNGATGTEAAGGSIGSGPLRPVRIIAHRGSSVKAPENTLAALKLAVEERADGVEFDVYRTADGKLVLLHDADVLRTTDFRRVFGREKNPRVESLTLAELQRLDVGTWKDAKFAGETMPTLRQALEVLKGRSTPVVEIKPKTIGGDVARAIREAGLEDEVFVQSFSSQAIREFRQVLPSVATGFLTSKRESPDAVVRARAHLREARIAGANAVVCDHKLVVAEYVAELHRHAMSLWVYTVDEPTTMEMLIRIGVDGIITNVPDVLRELLARPGRTIEPGGAKTGQRIDLLRGQVPIAVLLRGLADFTGLAVVHDAKDRAIATAEVLVAADVRSADAQIIEAHLNAAGIRLTRRRLASGRLVIEASSSSRVAGASEPRPRPIFVVESDRSRRVRASRSGSVSGAGRSSRVRRVAGVVFADIPETVAAQVEIDGGAGVFVRSVDDEVRGGLRVLRRFDIVTRLGGRVVRSPAEVVADLERYRGGDDLTIRLLRKGELKILRVKR